MPKPTARSISRRSIPALIAAALLAPVLPGRLAADSVKPEEVQGQLAIGRQALQHGDFRSAYEAYTKADRLAGGGSAEALDNLAMIDEAAGQIDDGVKAARRGVKAAKTPDEQFRLQNRLGLVLFHKFQAQSDPKALDEAIGSFRQAFELTGGQRNEIRFSLGVALLAGGQEEEGRGLLQAYLKRQPAGAEAEQAKLLLSNPRRARDAYAPDFSVVTLDGKPLSNDDLKGKVVLVDFWATWCGPCRQSAPAVKRIAEKLKQEPFTVFGVSADRDGKKLRDYLARAEEPWPQFWDESGQLARIFHVNAFPTFMVLGGDGRIVHLSRGWDDPGSERQLSLAIRRALDQLKSGGAGAPRAKS